MTLHTLLIYLLTYLLKQQCSRQSIILQYTEISDSQTIFRQFYNRRRSRRVHVLHHVAAVTLDSSATAVWSSTKSPAPSIIHTSQHKKVQVKGKDVDLYSAYHVQDTSNANLRHWNWAARPLFRSPPMACKHRPAQLTNNRPAGIINGLLLI